MSEAVVWLTHNIDYLTWNEVPDVLISSQQLEYCLRCLRFWCGEIMPTRTPIIHEGPGIDKTGADGPGMSSAHWVIQPDARLPPHRQIDTDVQGFKVTQNHLWVYIPVVSQFFWLSGGLLSKFCCLMEIYRFCHCQSILHVAWCGSVISEQPKKNPEWHACTLD